MFERFHQGQASCWIWSPPFRQRFPPKEVVSLRVEMPQQQELEARKLYETLVRSWLSRGSRVLGIRSRSGGFWNLLESDHRELV